MESIRYKMLALLKQGAVPAGWLFISLLLVIVTLLSVSPRESSLIKEPVQRDIGAILHSDTLRIITRNHPLTYYLYRGTRRGFDYELIKRYAEEQGLFLEVVIPPRWSDMISYLREGKGDIIASLMTVTPERNELVDFTRQYLEVWQVALGTEEINPPKTLEELNGRTVLVRKGSSYEERLYELHQNGIDVKVEILNDSIEIIDPVEIVARGLAPLTVVDNTVARLEQQFFPGLVEGVRVSEPQSIAWAVRPNAPELKQSLDEFLARYYRSAYFNILKKRYFENKSHFLKHRSAQLAMQRKGRISKFDDYFRLAAEETGIDWRLLAAQAYHESRFYPDKTSWAGAVGLMQLMPRTAEVMGVEDIYDPKQNIIGGAHYLRRLFDRYAGFENEDNQTLALAAYNVGIGHVEDARKLVVGLGGDPTSWHDVRKALISLEKPDVYQNTTYGFCRGRSVVAYVEDVLHRFQIFTQLVPEDPQLNQFVELAQLVLWDY